MGQASILDDSINIGQGGIQFSGVRTNLQQDSLHFCSYRPKSHKKLVLNNKESIDSIQSYLLYVLGVSSIRLTSSSIPSHAIRNDRVELVCNYDMEGDKLYSVKWSVVGILFLLIMLKSPFFKTTCLFLILSPSRRYKPLYLVIFPILLLSLP